ncbi:hypothetical protein [Streptomyces puniciscabiei]|uniref:hypothetical protein n=1 Tax=Streptomyces puniciscabiei TaxID=164348 RepID=UPI003317DF0A
MSEALDRVIEALAGVSEEEVAAALVAVGLSRPCSPLPSTASRTLLPSAGGGKEIVSEVEWV